MADFGTAVRNLRPGYIAKTPNMRGYLRRHELFSRVADDSKFGESTDPGYAHYTYSYDSATRTWHRSAPANSASRTAVYNKCTLPEHVGAVTDATAQVADVVFDLEFVENADWTQGDDSSRIYVFRCYQWGGSETTSGDVRRWRVARLQPDASSSQSSTASPPVVAQLPEGTSNGNDPFSELKLDAATFEILASGDWEYNQQTESDYVESSGSTARW